SAGDGGNLAAVEFPAGDRLARGIRKDGATARELQAVELMCFLGDHHGADACRLAQQRANVRPVLREFGHHFASCQRIAYRHPSKPEVAPLGNVDPELAVSILAPVEAAHAVGRLYCPYEIHRPVHAEYRERSA